MKADRAADLSLQELPRDPSELAQPVTLRLNEPPVEVRFCPKNEEGSRGSSQ